MYVYLIHNFFIHSRALLLRITVTFKYYKNELNVNCERDVCLINLSQVVLAVNKLKKLMQ